LKIGLLSYRSHPYSGGQGIYIKHLSKALKGLGHEVSVLSGPPYPELDQSIELIKIPSLGLFETEDRMKKFNLNLFFNPIDFYEWITVMTGGFPEPYTYGKRVLRYLRENQKEFDIILDNQSLSGSLLSIQKIYPLAVTIHHPITKDYKLEMESASNWKEKLSSTRWHNFLPMQKRVVPRLQNIICVSQPSKEDVINEFLAAKDNIRVIPNGIDINTFKPSGLTKELNFRIVTTASADIPLKGLRHLLSALPRIIRKFPLTTLTVIGKSPKKSKLNKIIDDLELEDRIIFKPLISTDSGGLKQVIGDAALKIKPGSVEEIEEGILKLFNEDELRTQLAIKGRKRMEEMFDWNIAAKNYAGFFEEIIQSFNHADN